jgi:hypothetical protein
MHLKVHLHPVFTERLLIPLNLGSMCLFSVSSRSFRHLRLVLLGCHLKLEILNRLGERLNLLTVEGTWDGIGGRRDKGVGRTRDGLKREKGRAKCLNLHVFFIDDGVKFTFGSLQSPKVLIEFSIQILENANF